MPSSGLPMEDLTAGHSHAAVVAHLTDAAKSALDAGLFIEWLESFVGAWNKTKNPHIAANAGLIEWDI